MKAFTVVIEAMLARTTPLTWAGPARMSS